MLEGRAVGSPQLVRPSVSILQSVGMTPEGDLFYLTRTGAREVHEIEIDFAGGRLLSKPTPITASVAGANSDPSYSPDGHRMAYVSERSPHRARRRVIVVRDLETSGEHEIEPQLRLIRELRWSPDSSDLLFVAGDRKGRQGVYRIAADGGEASLVFRAKRPGNVGWMSDGESVHYLDPVGDEGAHHIFNLADGAQRRILPPEGYTWLTLSPDGSRFALIDRRFGEQGRTILATLEAQTGERNDLLRLEGTARADFATAWTPDGKTILFWRRDKSSQNPQRRELWAIAADGGEPRPMNLGVDLLSAPGFLSVHPDGRRLAYSAGDPKYEIWKFSNFLDRLETSD